MIDNYMTTLTRFEYSRLIGARALQLALGAPPLIEIPKGVTDPYILAKKELEAKVLPMVVVRTWPGGKEEVVSL